MKPEELLGLAIPLVFLLIGWLESRSPARPFELVGNWRWLGTAFLVLTLVVAAATPLLLPAAYLREHGVLDLSGLGLWGVPIGVLTTSFLGYWWHRAEHHFHWLWRATHQLHHSPPRVDIWGAFYAHPLEVACKVALGAVASIWLLGLSPLASAVVGLLGAGFSMFQHWNIRTPTALGYLLQRPESHCLHHEREMHTRNFSDLPLWDILFGTFQNPPAFHGEVGFGGESSRRIAHMLLMRDANR